MNYVFDVDGTLTPPRSKMDETFKSFFIDWCKDKNVYLVSGSDVSKIIEQVGQDMLDSVTGYFCDGGNTEYCKGKLLNHNTWKYSDNLLNYLWDVLIRTKYKKRNGNYMEIRTGMINISTVGRSSKQEERDAYEKWDKKHKERKKICRKIKRKFNYMEAVVGGQISIDIFPKGCDKSQIVDKIKGTIHYFGDKTEKGGNDYTIAERMIYPNTVTPVSNWAETAMTLLFL